MRDEESAPAYGSCTVVKKGGLQREWRNRHVLLQDADRIVVERILTQYRPYNARFYAGSIKVSNEVTCELEVELEVRG